MGNEPQDVLGVQTGITPVEEDDQLQLLKPAEILKAPQWEHIQLYWESLEAFCEHIWEQNDPEYMPYEGEPPLEVVVTYGELNWDLLRMFIDSHLRELDHLVLKKLLTSVESKLIQKLFQMRFDQVLTRLNYQRQKLNYPFAVAPDPYLRPLYSRYHALREVEELFKTYKTNPEMEQRLTLDVTQHIVEDMNMELMEQYALTLPTEDKDLIWPLLLNVLVALSCNEIHPYTAMQTVLKMMRQENILDLAIRVLHASPFPRSLESALSMAGPVPQPEVRKAIHDLLKRQEVGYKIHKKTIQTMASHPEPEDLPVLLAVIQSPIEDFHERDTFFHQVREAAIVATQSYRQESEARTQLLQILQTVVQSPVVSHVTQLQAIRMLAQSEIYVGFELVADALHRATANDYSDLQELAATTLVHLRDRRAIPFLITALNTLTRSETVIERYKGVFQKEKQTMVDHFCRCLQQFGVQVAQDIVTGEWFEDD